MRVKLGVLLGSLVLLFAISATAGAQTRYRTRDGRTVIVYPNQRRVYQPVYRQRYRSNYRNWRRPNYAQPYNGRGYGARTYRLPNGRLVTVLPNGRRIYR
jgi:hypothetical protein